MQFSGGRMIRGFQRGPELHCVIGVRPQRRPALCSSGSSSSSSMRSSRHSSMLQTWKGKGRMGRIYVGEATEKAKLVRKVNSEELEVALQNRDKPMVVDFYASWCGPCVLMATELEKVAEELGDAVEILKIDTDENPELSSQLKIQGLPTMLFVATDPSKPALRVEGLVPAETVKEIIENDLQTPDSMEEVQ